MGEVHQMPPWFKLHIAGGTRHLGCSSTILKTGEASESPWKFKFRILELGLRSANTSWSSKAHINSSVVHPLRRCSGIMPLKQFRELEAEGNEENAVSGGHLPRNLPVFGSCVALPKQNLYLFGLWMCLKS